LGKYQALRVTEASLYASAAWSIIDAVESNSEEFDPLEAGVPYWLVSPADTLSKLRRAAGGSLDVTVRAPMPGELGSYTIKPLDVEIVVYSDPEAWSDYSLDHLYDSIVRSPLTLDSTMLRELAYRTDMGMSEYLVAYLSWGEAVILEGERFNINVPLFEEVKVAYHTHPRSACALSKADVESLLSLMVNRGVGGGIATVNCALRIWRRGFLLEDDFIALKRHKGPLYPGGQPTLQSVLLEVMGF